MQPDITETIQRTRRYWHIDGLVEIGFGAFSLLLSAYFALQVALPEESFLSNLVNSSFIIVFLGGVVLLKTIVKIGKTRLTYPRTGYVAYVKDRSPKRRVAVGLLGMAISLTLVLLFSGPLSQNYMPAATGLVFAVAVAVYGYRVDVTRFYLLGLACLLAGVGLSLTGIESIAGLSAFYFFTGLAFLLSGGLTLRAYLRQTAQLEISNE
jgi:hypothetical protein